MQLPIFYNSGCFGVVDGIRYFDEKKYRLVFNQIFFHDSQRNYESSKIRIQEKIFIHIRRSYC